MDETQKRLLDWTYGQPPSERLAALVLDEEGYKDIDPSHPLGGPDGGRDGECTRDGEAGVWAVYFLHGKQTFKTIADKLTADIEAARKHNPEFIAFVTNQPLLQSERRDLRLLGGDIRIDLFHMERVASILDRPRMAPVREKFLRIPPTEQAPAPVANEQLPLSITATVADPAYMFTDDAEVLDRFVAMEERRIREKSDEGHKRVRAEREAKAKAEQEKLARQAQQQAEKARREAREAATPRRPWDTAGIEMPRVTDYLNDGILNRLAQQYSSPPSMLPRFAGLPGSVEPPKPPEPLSDEQIEARVATYRAELESRWPSCRDYLAGIAWPALRCRIKNEAKSFLTDVEVVLTFHGARGVRFEKLDDFDVRKFEDPSWTPRDPYHVVPIMRHIRPADYPISWRHNDNGDLEVTVTLKLLRPLSEWRGDDYGPDFVLIVEPSANVDSVEVTYVATAAGYGDVFEGEPITVPVQKLATLEVLRDVIDATRESQDGSA